jgi:hypothetical protein
MHFEIPFKCRFCDLVCDSIHMDLNFNLFQIQFCVIELLNYYYIRSIIGTSVFKDPKLELQPLDCQINVLLDLKLELIFLGSQMHSPLHINVAKLFNWVSYDCHNSVNICKW